MAKPTSYTLSGSTADGEIISPDMTTYLERGYISILFYSDAAFQTLATPTAGTVTFEGSETGDNYGSLVNGEVDLTQPTYARPNFAGPIKKVKATFSGVTDADFFVATISKYGGV